MHAALKGAATAAALVALAVAPATAGAAGFDGALDASFGDSGFAFTVPDGLEGARYAQLIQQADGKVVGAVWSFTSSHVQVTRHTTAGQPDAGFGAGGVADIDLPQGQFGTAAAVREMADHSLVVAGPLINDQTALAQVMPHGANRFFLAHLSAAGAQIGDIAIGQAPSDCFSLELLRVRADGGALAITGGCKGDGFGAYEFGPDAAPDATFTGGVHPGAFTNAFPVDAVLGDNAIHVLSVGYDSGSDTWTSDVTELDAHGAEAAGFGTDGHATFPGEGTALALDGAGRPIVAGGDERGPSDVREWRATRLTTAGAPDPGFGTDGRGVVTSADFGALGQENEPGDIAVDGKNRVYLAASQFAGPLVARLTSGGTLDHGFGSATTPGVAHYDGSTFTLDDMLVQADGRPVLGIDSQSFRPELRAASSAVAPRQDSIGLMRIDLAPADPAPVPDPKPVTQTPAPAIVTAAATPPKVTVVRTCLSRRNFSIRLKPRGRRIVAATVRLGGKVIAVRRGKRLRSTIDLRNTPVGTFTVRIDTTTADGKKYRDVRTYHTCRVGPDVSRPVKGGSHVTTTVS